MYMHHSGCFPTVNVSHSGDFYLQHLRKVDSLNATVRLTLKTNGTVKILNYVFLDIKLLVVWPTDYKCKTISMASYLQSTS